MTLLNWIARIRDHARFSLMIRSEREYHETCQQRPHLSDDEFIQRFYPNEIDRAVPLRVRRILAEQLGFDRVEPQDRPCDILQDIDLSAIVWEIAEDFGLSIDDSEIASLDGSVDSIIKLVVARRKTCHT
jgi:acyl carrier protein